MVRQQCTTPIAMGELFTNPNEWKTLIANRLIDFIRCHISAIGGLTPALKLATLCEAFGVRTAWHGPPDVSPVGHAANVHLDVSRLNFGVQEWSGFSEIEEEMFPGCPRCATGMFIPMMPPAWGSILTSSWPPNTLAPMACWSGRKREYLTARRFTRKFFTRNRARARNRNRKI